MERRRLMGKLFAYIIYSITNVNKKYGNSSFVNPLSMSGDGTVTYTSNNTAVATIDNNGNVTIIAPGEAIITASVEDTLDFEYENNSASYTLIVAKADGNISEPPTPKTIVYDGDDHQLINAGIGTGTMLYKFDYDEEWDEIIPIASESGTYTILYKSSENQYYTESSIGTVDVIIQKALSQYIAPTPVSPLVYNTNAQNLLNEGSTNDGLIRYSTDEINWSTNVPQGTNAGDYRTYWELKGDYNHTDIPSTLITVTMDRVTPTVTPPCEGLVIPYDGETHELIQCGSTDYGTLKYSLDGVTYSTSIPTASAMDDYIIYWMVEGNSNVNDIEPATVQASISGIIVLNPTINLEYNLIDYDGTAKQPSVEVLDDDNNIIPSSEYTVIYLDNIDAGTAIVTITDVTGGTYVINGTKTFKINKIDPTYIAPTAKTGLVYNGDSQLLLNSGSVTSGGTMLYSSDEVTWSENNNHSETNAGKYKTYWKIIGDNNHNNIDSILILVTIDKAPVCLYTAPTYTFPIYNCNALNLLNAGSTGCTMLYSSDNSTWSTTIPQGTNAGTYTSYWRIVGDNNHYGLNSTSIQTDISKCTPTIVVPTAKTLTYNGSALLLVNAGSVSPSCATLEYNLNNSTWSTSVPTATNGGSYIVYYRVPGNSNINEVSGNIECTISAKVPSSITVELSQSTYTYDGNAKTPTVTVKDGNTTIPSSEYTVTYTNNVHAGTATITITDKSGGNYSFETKIVNFTINKASISPVVTMSGWTYEGTSTSPSVSGNSGNGTVTYYYKVNSADDSTYTGTKPGSTSTATTYKVKAVISETNDYLGATVYTTFNISKASGRVTISGRTLTYNGNSQNLVTVSGATGTMHYRVGTSGEWSTSIPTITNKTSSSNTDSWTIYYYIDASTNYNGCGNSSTPCGSVTTTMEKLTPTITAPTAKSAQAYTGSALTLLNPGSTNAGELLYSLDHVNWSTSIPTAINNGTYLGYYRVKGNNNVYSMPKESPYYYTVSSTSSIVEKTVTATVIPEYNSTIYDKTAKTPSVTVKDGNTVIPSSEYTVSYSNNINAGTATITITDKSGGNYAVTGSVTFTITLKEVCLTWGTLSWTYDGSAHSTTCTVGCLISGDSCSATLSGNSITNKGTTTVTATGLSNSNYKLPSSKTNTLTISARPINVTAGSNSKTYDGSALTYNSATAESTGTNRGLASGHSMTSCTVTGTITNKGSVNNVPSGAVIKSGSTDVTSNYSISYVNGTLTINARPINVTASSSSRAYNGSALTSNSATAEGTGTNRGLVSGHSMTSCTVSGTITNVGSVNNVPSKATIKSGSTDVTSNYSITYINGTLTITKANISPSVSLSDWSCCNTANNPSVSGNSGNGTVTYNYKVSTAADSTYTATKPSNPGTYTVRAQIAATTNYNAGTATSNFTISKCNISPSVSMSGWTYGGTASNPSVSGNSGGGSVTYNYKVSTAADSTYTTTKPTNAGTYTVRALIAATTCYNAGTATNNFTISRANISPSVSLSDWSCCGTASNPSVSGNSGSGTVTYNYKVSTANDSTYTTTKPSNPGTYTVRASIVQTTNYNSGTATKNFTINACSLSFSVSGRTLTYNESNLNLVTTSGTSVGTVTYTVSGSSTNSIPVASGCGTYSISWSSAGNTCYTLKSGTVSTTINKGSTTISANPTAKTLTYNGAAQSLLQGGTANRTGSWSYGSGTYVNTYNDVAWSFTPSNSCYESKSGKVSGAKINARAITVTGNSANHTYDGSGKSVSGGSITSGSLGTGDTITITASGASGTNAGSYTNSITSVVIKKGSTDVTNQYSITKVNGSLSISKRPINVTAGSTSKTYDGSALTYNSATAESTGTNRGLVSGHSMTSCTVTGSITNKGSVNNVPSSAVIKSGSTNVTSNYNINYVNGTLTVNARAVTYRANNETWAYNGSTHSASNTATLTSGSLVSGHTATFSCSGSIGPDVGYATKTLSSVTIKSGSTDVSGNYSITRNDGILYINRVPGKTGFDTTGISITYSATTAQKTGTGATGTLSVSSSNTNIATVSISGNTITVTRKGYGSATITVTAALATNYNQATSTFSVSCNKASGLITCPTANTLTYNGLAEYLVSSGSSSTGTVYYNVGSGSYSTSRPSAINPGTYTVHAYAAAATNYNQSSTCTVNVTISKYTPTLYVLVTNRAYNGSALYATAIVYKPTNGVALTGTIYYGTSPGATTYSVSYSGGTVNLSSVSVTNVGSATVYAHFVPNSSCNAYYNNSNEDGKTFTVSRTNCSGPTVSGRTVAYNRSALALATVSGNCGTMHYRLGTSGSWINSIPTATDIGAYTVYWYMDASTNYNGKGSSSSPAGSVTGNITTNYINLGLPSGTLWSYTNIGSANEGSYGNHYMYGLKTTYSSSATPYSGMENPLSTSQDAAYNYSNGNYSFGSNWRTPTAGQAYELLTKCTITEVTANGLNCYKFTGPNGNYIVIPKAGYYKLGTYLESLGLTRLWTSTPGETTSDNKGYLLNKNSSIAVVQPGNKSYGYSLRPVYFNSNTRGISFVDLGLPSGTLWADKNVGAGKATDAGTFFKYGVTSAYLTSLTPYSGTASIIGTSRDQARVIWGGTWHLPTSALITELFNNTNLSVVTINSVKCLKLANKNSANLYILMPLVGYYYTNTGNMQEVGNQMRFWSGTPYDSTHANIGVAHSDGSGTVVTEGASGLSVRAVL